MGAICGSRQQVGRCSARSSSIAQASHPIHGESCDTVGITGPSQQERASALGGWRRDQIGAPHFPPATPRGWRRFLSRFGSLTNALGGSHRDLHLFFSTSDGLLKLGAKLCHLALKGGQLLLSIAQL
jgi:hypothetical protein